MNGLCELNNKGGTFLTQTVSTEFNDPKQRNNVKPWFIQQSKTCWFMKMFKHQILTQTVLLSVVWSATALDSFTNLQLCWCVCVCDHFLQSFSASCSRDVRLEDRINTNVFRRCQLSVDTQDDVSSTKSVFKDGKSNWAVKCPLLLLRSECETWTVVKNTEHCQTEASVSENLFSIHN